MARGKKVAKGGAKKKTRSSKVGKKAAGKAKKKAPAAGKKAVAKKKAATKKKAPVAKKKAAASARKKIAGTVKPRAASRKSAGAKYVFGFGGGKSQGRAGMKNLLGGKGANLAEMASLGFPVPPGFTVSTDVCTYFYDHGRKYPVQLEGEVRKAVAEVERLMGKGFGDPNNPLLVSVRSGARISMPGMMDTVLNLGLNDRTVRGLAEASGSERFAYDSYRRFVQMYGDVVLEMKPESKTERDPFEVLIEEKKAALGTENDLDLTTADLRALVAEFKELVRKRTGKRFPDDPWEQLWGAVGAVFGSWMNQRAITYRKIEGIPSEWGTAVNVQAMVFGNLGPDCATGVAFTRDPGNGNKKYYGEFLVNAQGEDVVAGTRTPQKITLEASRELARSNGISETQRKKEAPSLEEVMPKAYKELRRISTSLEKHYRDMQDIEFTIENKKLYMLQTRSGKRTAAAALKIAVDMVGEKLISANEGVLRVKPGQLDALLHPQVDPKATKDVLAKGLPASPGAAAGEVVFSADDAAEAAGAGRKTILVRVETSPEDIHGCLLYTSPSPRDKRQSRMPSSA